MQRKRDGLVPIGEVSSDLDGPVKAIHDASPQALYHFTRFDQVHQLARFSHHSHSHWGEGPGGRGSRQRFVY